MTTKPDTTTTTKVELENVVDETFVDSGALCRRCWYERGRLVREVHYDRRGHPIYEVIIDARNRFRRTYFVQLTQL